MDQTHLVIAIFEFVVLLFSLSLHEAAHGWMANRLGDPTAKMLGRVTLNPIRHIDPIGTILVPLVMLFMPGFGQFLIGWAKPTPVITRNFRKIVRDDNLTTMAGPVSNLILVAAAFLVLAGMALLIPNGRAIVLTAFFISLGAPSQVLPQPVALLCSLAILVNLSLFFFNLLPIPPLDGSRVLRNTLPYNAVQTYDRIPIWVSYMLMIFVGGYVLMALLRPSLGLIYAALVNI